MGDFAWQVLTNLAANLVSAVIIALLTVAVAYVYFLRRRHRLFAFFGVGQAEKGVGIYLSRLQIKPGGTEGVLPLKKGYVGPALTRAESMAACQLAGLFESRLLANVPRTVQQWLGRRHATLKRVQPTINASPLGSEIEPSAAVADAAADNQTLVIIGSPVYNVMAAYYFDNQSLAFRFGTTASGERAFERRDGSGWVPIPGRADGRELGVVQRLSDSEHRCTVFICAGLGSSGTFGAVRYLVQNWAELLARLGTKDFSICLEFKGQGPDCDGDDRSVVNAKVAWASYL